MQGQDTVDTSALPCYKAKQPNKISAVLMCEIAACETRGQTGLEQLAWLQYSRRGFCTGAERAHRLLLGSGWEAVAGRDVWAGR